MPKIQFFFLKNFFYFFFLGAFELSINFDFVAKNNENIIRAILDKSIMKKVLNSELKNNLV